MQRIFIVLLGLIMLVCTGCEGNGPRPTTFGSASDPKKAAPVEYVASVKGKSPPGVPLAKAAPAAADPAGGAGEAPMPGGDGAANPGDPVNAQKTITINAQNLENIRVELGYNSAIVLKTQVAQVATGEFEPKINFITNTRQGLDFKLLTQAMQLYKADKGKLPQTTAEFAKMLIDNNIGLPELPPDNAFYVYDPTKESQENITNLEFLSEFVP
ncbi:MAG: hypothetical protein QM811_27135 [Pirellulales bacterium]